MVAGHVVAGSGLWEQPVTGRGGCLSLSSAWYQAGRHMIFGQETDMDRHDLQIVVEY